MMMTPLAWWAVLLGPAVWASAVAQGHGHEGALARRSVMLQRREYHDLSRGASQHYGSQEETPEQRQERYRNFYDEQLSDMRDRHEQLHKHVHEHGHPDQQTHRLLANLPHLYRNAQDVTRQPGSDTDRAWSAFMDHQKAFNEGVGGVKMSHKLATLFPHYASS